MPSISLRFSRPANPEDFELLCVEFYKREWGVPDVQKLGRRGHKQWGIDLVGVDDQGLLRAVQCRLHEEGKELTASEVKDTVSKAKTFPKPLGHLTIATTAPRDPNLQILASEITVDHLREGLFRVTIASWDDLTESLHWPEVDGQFTASPTAEQGRRMLGAIDGLRSDLLPIARDVASLVGDTVDTEIDQAANFVEQGQPQVAKVLLDRIERRCEDQLTDHHRFRLLANRGNAAKGEEDFAVAARYYLEARRHSDGEKARYLEALAHLFLGELAKAHELGLKLRQDYPASGLGDAIIAMSAPPSIGVAELEQQVGGAASEDNNVALALALRALNEGGHAAAEHHARRVLEHDPRSLGAKEVLAMALLSAEIEKAWGQPIAQQGGARARLTEAMGLLQTVLDSLKERGSRDHLAVLHYHKSHVYRLLSEPVEAAAELGAAYAGAPMNQVIAAGQAFALAEDDKLDQGIAILERLSRPLAPRSALVLAQLLGQRGRKADFAAARDLLAAGTEAASVEPAGFRCAWAGVLVRLSLSLGEPQVGLEAVRQLPPGFLEHASTDTLRGMALAKAGRKEEATDAASAALAALTASTSILVREYLARLLASLGAHEQAVRVWRTVVTPTEVNHDVRGMLSSAAVVGDEDLILEFCRALRANGGFDPDVVDLELKTAYQRGPRLAVEVANELLASPIGDRLARRVRLFLAHIGLGIHDTSLLNVDPASLPAADEVTPEEGRAVVEVLRHATPGLAAVDYAYDLLRRFPDHPLVAQGLLAVMVGPGSGVGEVATPARAAVGTAIRYSILGEAADEWVIIENGPDPSFSQRELPPDHKLAVQLIGKAVGEEFFIREGPPQPIRAVVKEILHKAVYRFQTLLLTAEERFPEAPIVQRFKVDLDNPEPEKQFAAIIAIAERHRQQVQTVQDAYRAGMMPLAAIANLLHSSVFDLFVDGFVGSREVPLRCSEWTAASVGQAAQALALGQPLVLDSTAIFSLFALEALENLHGLAVRLVISENTLYALRGAQVLSPNALQPAGFVGSEAGRLWYRENDPARVQLQQARLNRFIGELEEQVEVTAAPPLGPVEPSKRRPLVETLGRSELDALLLAKLNGWTLWTDDQVLAQLGRAEFGVRRVWTETVVRWLGGTGAITPDTVSEWVLALLGRNYRFTSLTVEDAVHAAGVSSWDAGREPLATALGRLGDNEWATPSIFRLAGEFVVRAWRASLSDVLAEALTVSMAKQLASRNEGVDLLAALAGSMDLFFGLDALNARRAKTVIDTYLRTQSGRTS